MANPYHVDLLRHGQEEWNIWRLQNPEIRPNLSYANLQQMDLSKYNLAKTNLSHTNLSGTVLIMANLRDADLHNANLTRADFRGSHLKKANLSNALLHCANFDTLSRENNLRDLAPLASLARLRALDLSGYKHLNDLSPLATIPQLTILNLTGCKRIANLEPLSALSQLTTLNLTGCTPVQDLAPLASLRRLTTLNLTGCKHITDLAPLALLSRLHVLNLTGCKHITDLTPLAFLSHLATLNLTGCQQIRSLTPVASIPQLTIIGLQDKIWAVAEAVNRTCFIQQMSTSESFRRFVDSFLADINYQRWHDGLDRESLQELSLPARNLAEHMLLHCLTHTMADSRTIVGLGILRSYAAAPYLKQLLCSTGPSEVVDIAVALWQIERYPAALSTIIDVLKHTNDAFARMYAAIGLQNFRCQQTAQALKYALYDKDHLVRHHAAMSLFKLHSMLKDFADMHDPLYALTIEVMAEDIEKRQLAAENVWSLVGHLYLPHC
ncbi:hypothetical protein EPA93_17000 [Ktedonosporobacter rubrisoli]|uniref:Leucine-rich repeat domain-containing protein n=1 Tax=Ktedonosporobacter rubrisoli TaxID=2509675 RepID=A0A4P6JQA2_KTERU|nr:leucine-rich repeat domain-containing protein [Ktedonosporobacter rubrisoli]QBD77597.1 hypothetical protein EPA93_17000 [Ktedonosporobacter rubrisoli]